MPRLPLAVALVLALAVLAGCAGEGPGETTTSTTGTSGPKPGMPLRIASPDFSDGGAMPRTYSCDANAQRQVSPPLNVTNIPAGTESLALVMLDPDVPVPEAPTQTRVHWLVWNVNVTGPEVRFPQGGVPPGAVEGTGDGGPGYSGPCPPPGSSPHRYNFTVYALDTRLTLDEGADRAALDEAMQGHIRATARIVGTYARQVVVS